MAKLRIKSRYGIIPNSLLNNKDISAKAKGLFGYLQSKPDDWDFSAERISVDFSDGRDSIRAGLKELEKHGFLERERYQNERGFFDIEYVLIEKPVTGNPSSDNPTSEKPSLKKERNSKKEVVNNSILSKDNNTIEDEPLLENLGLVKIEDKEKRIDKRNPEVQGVIDTIRTTLKSNKFAYSKGKYERERAGNIATNKEIMEICQERNIPLDKFIELIVLFSQKTRYTKKINSPADFFYNWASIYNTAITMKEKKMDETNVRAPRDII